MATSKALRSLVAVTAVFTACWMIAAAHAADKSTPAKTELASLDSSSAPADGKELFTREWMPKDARSHGGDGLGPVFNDSSCVACHNLGGTGGGGPASKNVDIITAFANPVGQQQQDANLFGDAQPSAHTLPAAIIDLFVEGLTQNQARPTSSQAHARNVAVPLAGSQTRTTNGNQPAKEAPATPDDAKKALAESQKKELSKIHPGFLSARSVVLHRFSTDEKYEPWRMTMMGFGQFGMFNAGQVTFDNAAATTATLNVTDAQPAADADIVVQNVDATVNVVNVTRNSQDRINRLRQMAFIGQSPAQQSQVGNFAMIHSKRNTTALFGIGLIDKIPDNVLVEQSKKQFKDYPEIQGRVSKMKDGQIGRFGWKAQKPNLYEFAMTACSVELGLEVPDHPQAGTPLDAKYKAKGYDMDKAECDALVDYLKNIPAPAEHKAINKQESEILSAGKKQFAAVGCANCHAEKLGEVAGIYSDLLLHDMGEDLGDSGNYGSFVPDAPEEEQQNEPIPSLVAQRQPVRHMIGPQENRDKIIGALRQEWRTPPLWGVRDSGPYLHDGRAETLEQAIAFHGGQAKRSVDGFFQLKPEEQMQLITFLKSLTAPESEKVASAN